MAYNPQVPPQNPEELLPYLNEEFLRASQVISPLQNGEWAIAHEMPKKVKPGMVKIFDGVNTDPLGTGDAGVYWYGDDALWHFAGPGDPYVPPPDPVPTAWANITPTNGWTVISQFAYRKWSYHTDLTFSLAAGTYAEPGPIVIGSLPVGFRPPVDMHFPITTATLGSITALPRVRVRANGDIDIFNVPTGSSQIFGTCVIPIDVL